MSHSQPIRSEDSGAVQQLQARIAEAGQLQERMKSANKIVRERKLTEDEKIARLGAECGIPPDGARQLLKPNFAGRIGFPNYKLTNNGANLRRMQERVKTLTKEGARSSVTVEFPGGRMEDNAEDCRIRIYHDAKPAAEVIKKLKMHGFHWSARLTCWSRLRNESARYYASQVTGVPWPNANNALVSVAGDEARVQASPTVQTTRCSGGARVGIAP
jgi:hypothetical protein